MENDKTAPHPAAGRSSATPKPAVRKPVARCEDCEFYDYDEDMDAYVCQVALDEDEMAQFVAGHTGRCPYYRFYDEYKSVHKQI